MKAQCSRSLDAKIGECSSLTCLMSLSVLALLTSGSFILSTLLSLVDNWLHAKMFCMVPILYMSFNFSESEDPFI